MSLASIRDLCQNAAREHAAGNFQAALACAEAAVGACRIAPGIGPDHYAYALSLCTLGWAREAVGGEAHELFAMAAAAAKPLAETDAEHALVVLSHAADFALSSGQNTWAESLVSELADLHARYFGLGHPRTHASARLWGRKLAGRS